MLEKIDQQNSVQMHLYEILKERFDWEKYDAKMCIFPEFSTDDIRSLCCSRKVTWNFILLFIAL